MLIVDRAGIIRELSGVAGALLDLTGPGTAATDVLPWLGTGPHLTAVSGLVRDREFTARPTELDNGDVAWWLADDLSALMHDAETALRRERERAAFLDEVSAVLTASLNFDRCMESVVRMASRRLADAAVVVAPARAGQVPLVCGQDGTVEHRLLAVDPAMVAGLSEALQGFPPVPSRWIDPASVPDWLVPDGFVGSVGSAVITPLPGHGVPAGALVLLRRSSERAFTEGEEVFARLFAARAGAALSAARLYAEQSTITQTLMRELLPPTLRRLPGVDLAGGYRAAEDFHAVGGDFYDLHPASTPDGETLLVLGDVCGKGLDAAVMTGKIRNTLHALAHLADDHANVLQLLNNTLLSPTDTRFATLVLASISTRDDGVRLRLSSAGHPPPLIVRNDGRVETADTDGSLVGVMPVISSRTFVTSLAPGETCLLFTDGVTEARGGPLGNDMFGDEQLAAILGECTRMPAAAVVEHVMMVTSEWVNQRAHDDIAVVAITAPRNPRLDPTDEFTTTGKSRA